MRPGHTHWAASEQLLVVLSHRPLEVAVRSITAVEVIRLESLVFGALIAIVNCYSRPDIPLRPFIRRGRDITRSPRQGRSAALPRTFRGRLTPSAGTSIVGVGCQALGERNHVDHLLHRLICDLAPFLVRIALRMIFEGRPVLVS